MDLEATLDKYCGEKMFGKSVPNSVEKARNKILRNLESGYTSTWFNTITPGHIVTEYPTDDDYVNHLVQDLRGQLQHYEKYGNIKVEDIWAQNLKRRNCSLIPSYFVPPTQKRFVAVPQSKEDFIKDQTQNVEGFLAELYLTWFLNKNVKCPECGVQGKIALAGASSCNHSVAFQDGVCMNCREKGVNTVFEYKIRNNGEHSSVYAGNYISVQTFLQNKIKLYIVIADRKTGTVHIGKVIDAVVKMNEKFLYTIQEDLYWGNPSSIIFLDPILKVESEPLSNILNETRCQALMRKALDLV